MDNIIQALKANELPFGLMTEEMQAKADELGIREFIQYRQKDRGGVWDAKPFRSNEGFAFYDANTYRLSPDYKETPNLIECEVERYDNYMMGYRMTEHGSLLGITHAIERSDFVGFKYTDSRIEGGDRRSFFPRMFLRLSDGTLYFAMQETLIDKYEVLTPTHCLFRSCE